MRFNDGCHNDLLMPELPPEIADWHSQSDNMSVSESLGRLSAAESTSHSPLVGSQLSRPLRKHKWNAGESVLCLTTCHKHIYAGTASGQILVLRLDTYKVVQRLSCHDGAVYCLVVTGDAHFLFSGGGDSLITVWNLGNWNKIYTIYSSYDTGDVFSLAWSECLETLFIGTQDASIQWIQLLDKDTYRITDNPKGLPLLRFDRFFDSRGPGGVLHQCQSHSHRSRRAAAGGQNGQETLAEIPAQNVRKFAHNGYVNALVTRSSQASQEIALISGGGDGCIKLWSFDSHSVKSPSQLEILTTLAARDSVLCLSPTLDSFVHAGLGNGEIAVVDLDAVQVIRTKAVFDKDPITSIEVRGTAVFSTSNKSVATWDMSQPSALRFWEAHTDAILCCHVLSCDDESGADPLVLLLTAANDNCIALWDLSNVIIHRANLPIVPSRQSLVSVEFHDEQLISILRKFVSFRTISSQPDLVGECRECASFLKSLFGEFGATAKLLPTATGNPIMLGSFAAKSQSATEKCRILFYGHYDVIPASGHWLSNPYRMDPRDGYIYGRGVSDNKGPVLAAVFAVAELFRTGELYNDVVFVIEGQEEAGSEEFAKTIAEHKDEIGQIDWILLSNSYWIDDHTPCLNYGLRGIISANIGVRGPNSDVHSGVHGGTFREPTMDLVQLLSKLSEPGSSQINIPGFYKDVRAVDCEETRLYRDICDRLNICESEIQTMMKKWRYPSLTVHRIQVSGPDNMTVIPQKAQAVISMRTVPDQSAHKLEDTLRSFLREEFEKLASSNVLEVAITQASDPWVGDVSNDAFRVFAKAVEDEWGIEPLFIREGGSIPVVRFLEKMFQAAACQIPTGQASDRAHLDNERLRITNLFAFRNIMRRSVQSLRQKPDSRD